MVQSGRGCWGVEGVLSGGGPGRKIRPQSWESLDAEVELLGPGISEDLTPV